MNTDLNTSSLKQNGTGKKHISYFNWKENIIRPKPSIMYNRDSKNWELKENKLTVYRDFMEKIYDDIILKIWSPLAETLYNIVQDISFEKSRIKLLGVEIFFKINEDRIRKFTEFVDQENIFFSYGELDPLEDLKVEFDAFDNDILNIRYKAYTGIDQSMRNHFLGGIAISHYNYLFFDLPNAKRETGGTSISIDGLDGQKVRLFLYFQNSAQDNFSVSRTVLCKRKAI